MFHAYFSLIYALASASFLLSQSFDSERISSIMVQSPNDLRTYKNFVLDNGLNVLVVSDPTTSEAAASMDVGMGYFGDPDEIPGLAHFCEHMLFIATEKYPTEGEFQLLFTKYAGSTNAYTSAENTNFYFNIQPLAFRAALGIWSEFFISPLFSESAVQREINAVNGEFMKNKNQDSRRLYQLLKANSNPTHPFHKFPTGNSATLGSLPVSSLVASLKSFHSEWYIGKFMNLVLLSNHSIETLEQWGRDLFSRIKVGTTEPLSNTYKFISPFTPAQLQKQVFIVPVQNDQSLYFYFSTTPESYLSKSFHYLSYTIGSEDPHSLSNFLKSKGWVTVAEMGFDNSISTFSIFSIHLGLTTQGFANYSQVVETVFCFLDVFSKFEIEQRYWTELKQLAGIGFTYQESPKPAQYAAMLSNNMRRYQVSDWLQGGYMYESYLPQEIISFRDNLTRDNCLIHVISRSFQGTTTSKEFWYGTDYSESPLPASTECTLRSELESFITLPAPNTWIPTSFKLYPSPQGTDSVDPIQFSIPSPPILFEGWSQHSLPSHSNLPKADLNLIIKTPIVNQDPQMFAMSQLYLFSIIEAMQETLNPAFKAGYSYSLLASSTGISIHCGGWTEGVFQIFSQVFDELTAAPFQNPALANRIKQALLDSYINSHYQTTYSNNLELLYSLTKTPLWSQNQMLSALSNTVVDNQTLARWWQEVFSHSSSFQFYIYGNFIQEDVVQFCSRVESKFWNVFNLIYLPFPTTPRRTVVLPYQNSISQSTDTRDVNSATLIYYQGDFLDIELSVEFGLLTQILAPKFFEQLRTQQGLGYVVSCQEFEKNGVSGLFFVVQSATYNSTVLASRIQGFIDWFLVSLKNKTNEEFQAWKTGYLSSLYQSPFYLPPKARSFPLPPSYISLSGVAGATWEQIRDQTYFFSKYLNRKIELAQQLNFTRFQQFCSIIFSKTCQRQLSILIDPPSAIHGNISSPITSIQSWIESQNLFPTASLATTLSRVSSPLAHQNFSYYSICEALLFPPKTSTTPSDSQDSTDGTSPGFVLGMGVIIAVVSSIVWFLVYYFRNKQKKEAAFRRLKQLNEDIDNFAVGEDPYTL